MASKVAKQHLLLQLGDFNRVVLLAVGEVELHQKEEAHQRVGVEEVLVLEEEEVEAEALVVEEDHQEEEEDQVAGGQVQVEVVVKLAQGDLEGIQIKKRAQDQSMNS